MIDPHVHLRDWNQSAKETLEHGLKVAYESGLCAVFEMPNTDPVLTSRESIKKRIALADKSSIPIFHALYAGITSNTEQIEEVVIAHEELSLRVVGLKMFAGHSTGNMGIIKEEEQQLVYRTLADLDYRGVLAVHCEKESRLRPELWIPSDPFSHTLARPPESEVESVKDQFRFAREAGYKGTLHICHVSVPQSLEEIEKVRSNVDFKITCGATPHHCMMYDEMMRGEKGILLKMNPPLRPKEMQEQMLNALICGGIDWIETDHAPHTLEDKTEKHASGIPVLPFYPYFIKHLIEKGISQRRLRAITYNNIINSFELMPLVIPSAKKELNYGLSGEYEFDAFEKVRNL